MAPTMSAPSGARFRSHSTSSAVAPREHRRQRRRRGSAANPHMSSGPPRRASLVPCQPELVPFPDARIGNGIGANAEDGVWGEGSLDDVPPPPVFPESMDGAPPPPPVDPPPMLDEVVAPPPPVDDWPALSLDGVHEPSPPPPLPQEGGHSSASQSCPPARPNLQVPQSPLPKSPAPLSPTTISAAPLLQTRQSSASSVLSPSTMSPRVRQASSSAPCSASPLQQPVKQPSTRRWKSTSPVNTTVPSSTQKVRRRPPMLRDMSPDRAQSLRSLLVQEGAVSPSAGTHPFRRTRMKKQRSTARHLRELPIGPERPPGIATTRSYTPQPPPHGEASRCEELDPQLPTCVIANGSPQSMKRASPNPKPTALSSEVCVEPSDPDVPGPHLHKLVEGVTYVVVGGAMNDVWFDVVHVRQVRCRTNRRLHCVRG